jgi:hypothetical protein
VTDYRIPIEDIGERDPEWQELERGYGHETATRLRSVKWSPLTNEVESDGPTVIDDPPERPAP